MAKLSLKATQKALGIGTFVEKTIKYRGKDGEEIEGEIQIKIVAHDTIANAQEVWGDTDKVTMDQYRKALVFEVVFEDEKNKFFPTIEDTGTVSNEVISAMFSAADEVLDFAGKNWILNQKTNSGTNSSSMESVEKQ